MIVDAKDFKTMVRIKSMKKYEKYEYYLFNN